MKIDASNGTLDYVEDRTPEEILNEIRALNVEVELARRALENEKTIFGDIYGVNYIAYDEDCWTDSLRCAHIKYWGLVNRVSTLRLELEKSILR